MGGGIGLLVLGARAGIAAPLCADTALPGWTAAGPERGHVMSAAVGAHAAAVTTRAGVLTAPADLSRWSRDPRFPPQTRVMAYGPEDVVWASTPGHLWHIDSGSRIAALWERSLAVSLAPTDSADTVYAAVRGEQAGLYRVRGDTVTALLRDVDPWQVLARDGAVWLATLDQGIWHASTPDAPLVRVRDETATALGWVGAAPLAATREGTLLDLQSGVVVARLPGGWISAIAEADGLPLLVMEAAGIAVVRDGALQPVSFAGVDRDGGPMHMTGAWSLPDGGGGVLLGTFRRGPLRYAGGQVTPARTDFRGTVTGGIGGAPTGEILFAAMGTGVYLSADGQTWTAQHGHTGPVTDAVGVAWTGTGFAVTDFEGIAVRDSGGHWSRMTGTAVEGVPRRSGLVDVSQDAGGGWWALDDRGGLWHRDGETWTACTDRGLRLDGWGAHLRLASADGYRTLSACSDTNAVEQAIAGDTSRSIGPWLAAPGTLYRDGAAVAALPAGAAVQAIATRGPDSEEVLVALADSGVLRCTAREACAPVARCLPIETLAVGWLPDGRVWASEAQGTIQIAGGDSVPSPWSQTPPAQARPFPDQALLRPPWSQNNNPQPQAQSQNNNPAAAGHQQGHPGGGGGGRPPGTPPAQAVPSETPEAVTPEAKAWGCQSLPGTLSLGPMGLGVVVGLLSRRRSRSCRRRP